MKRSEIRVGRYTYSWGAAAGGGIDSGLNSPDWFDAAGEDFGNGKGCGSAHPDANAGSGDGWACGQFKGIGSGWGGYRGEDEPCVQM